MRMDPNMNSDLTSEQLSTLRDIQIARLGFIGASIAAIGDGIAAVAAGLAVDALENPIETRSQTAYHRTSQLETTQRNLDYYIHELIQLRKKFP